MSEAETTEKNKILTEDLLVVRNVAFVESIQSTMDVRVEVPFVRYECHRPIRRDFNFVTGKMYKQCGNSKRRAAIADFLDEISIQAEFVAGQADMFDITHEMEITRVPLRIISPEAANLLRAFRQVDSSATRLECARLDGRISNDQRDTILAPFFEAYSQLKGYIMHRADDKTAAQIGMESGIT